MTATMAELQKSRREAELEQQLAIAHAENALLIEAVRERDRRINTAAGIVRRFDATEVDRVTILLVEVRETLIGQDPRGHVPRRTAPPRLVAA